MSRKQNGPEPTVTSFKYQPVVMGLRAEILSKGESREGEFWKNLESRPITLQVTNMGEGTSVLEEIRVVFHIQGPRLGSPKEKISDPVWEGSVGLPSHRRAEGDISIPGHLVAQEYARIGFPKLSGASLILLTPVSEDRWELDPDSFRFLSGDLNKAKEFASKES